MASLWRLGVHGWLACVALVTVLYRHYSWATHWQASTLHAIWSIHGCLCLNMDCPWQHMWQYGTFMASHVELYCTIGDAGFKISLVQSSETSKNDSWTSGIPAGRQTTAYFWFSHKLHWLYILQTSEWYIRTSDFYNPLARQTTALNLKFSSLWWLGDE